MPQGCTNGILKDRKRLLRYMDIVGWCVKRGFLIILESPEPDGLVGRGYVIEPSNVLVFVLRQSLSEVGETVGIWKRGDTLQRDRSRRKQIRRNDVVWK